MISSDFLKKIRYIQITTSRRVTDVFAGQYHSVFKGRGMEFNEVREYMPGDEIRSIDWNVTARTGQIHVKKFIEERELTVMVLLDVSSSCFFGTTNQFKSQLACEICSLLAFSAIKNNDKAGLIVFDDQIRKFLPARKGARHVLRVIRDALFFSSSEVIRQSKPLSDKNQRRKTDINYVLEYLARVVKHRAIVFIISDFYSFKKDSAGESFDFKKKLNIANKRHDVIAVTITDPREMGMPDVGLIALEDAETGQTVLIDSSDPVFRREYKNNSLKIFKERAMVFGSTGIDHIDIRTDIGYMPALIKFFKKRERRH